MTKNRRVSLYIYSKVGGQWRYRKAPDRPKNLNDNSSYVLMWYQGEDANGKFRKRTLNIGKSADVAKIEIAKKKAELLNRIVDGKDSPEPELVKIGPDAPKPVYMVENAIEKFMGECQDRCGQDGYGFAKRSLIVYRRSLGYLREFGGGTPLIGVDEQFFKNYRRWLREHRNKFSDRSCHNILLTVNDRRASLDEEEVHAESRKIIQKEFDRAKTLHIIPFPEDGSAVQDTTRLSLVILGPEQEWSEKGALRQTISDWTRMRGNSPRLYPGSLIWCVRKEGRDMRQKVETLLAWRNVERDFLDGTLAGEFDKSDNEEIKTKRADAEEAVRDEVWAGYRYVVLYDTKGSLGVTVIDLGAGHSGSGETLTGRVISTLKSKALLNDSPGAGYLDRKWPEPFKKSGAWPISALRQAFLNGALERLLEPDNYLKNKLPEFVMNGSFGYASKAQGNGYSRVWFGEMLPQDEISFDSDVYLVLPNVAQALKSGAAPVTVVTGPVIGNGGKTEPTPEPSEPISTEPTVSLTRQRTVTVAGEIPTEVWNRLGRTLIPKLKTGGELSVTLSVSVQVDSDCVQGFQQELMQILRDLNLEESVKIATK